MKPLQIKVLLDGEVKENFLAIKKRHGFKSNAETIRYLITEEFNRMVEAKKKKGFDL